MGSKFLIYGPAGAGKTSVIEQLHKASFLTYEPYNLGDWYNKDGTIVHDYEPTHAWRSNHFYLWDLIYLRNLLREFDDTLFPLYIGGTAHNSPDAFQLFNKVFFLHASVDTYCSRVKLPERKSRYEISEIDKHKEWLSQHLKIWTPRYRELGCTFIDAEQPLEGVVRDILDASQCVGC